MKRASAPLKENILGITSVPGLERMQQLAGIAPCDVSVSHEDKPDPLSVVNRALDEIEECLPDITVADIQKIRARLISITETL